MMAAGADRAELADEAGGWTGRIPVRNLWLLMLYASELFRKHGFGRVGCEENPDKIPDLVAELLAHLVGRRLQRNLTYGYQVRQAVLGRVRGRIDLITTARKQLLARGLVACKFDDLTVNTPRNRYVRQALLAVAQVVSRRDLAHRCRGLGASLGRLGVSNEKLTWSDVSKDRFARHDAEDQYMVAAARLALDLAIPTENEGCKTLPLPYREIKWVRHLFERAIGGFYDVVLSSRGWRVTTGRPLEWLIERKTAGIDRILPLMRTDVILEHLEMERRIVIDTKFTSIVTRGWFRAETLRSGYVYQIYAYLRSQEGRGDPFADRASGLLLHPAIGDNIDETVVIQGHAIRFATVDLSAPTATFREQLIRLIESFDRGCDVSI